MSLIHKNSCECLGNQLNLFEVPATQVAITRSQYEKYFPITSLDSRPIEFQITTSDLEYLDVNSTLLYTKNRIMYADGRSIPGTVRLQSGEEGIFHEQGIVFPVNNFHSSRFKSLEVVLNNTTISEVDTLYPYRCYLETLLSFNRGAKETNLNTVLCAQDNNPDENFVDFNTLDEHNLTGRVNRGGWHIGFGRRNGPRPLK